MYPRSDPMDVFVNGKAARMAEGSTVSDLLESLGFTDGRIAVELNGDICVRAQHATTLLHEGDRLEVVSFVGGG